MSKTVWITGAAGFTGRTMIDHLRHLDEEIKIVGLDLHYMDNHNADNFHAVDICNLTSLEDCVVQHPPDTVIHLAGLMPPNDEERMRSINVGGTINLIRALQGQKNHKTTIINAGSAAEYIFDGQILTETSAVGGNNAYGRTKHEQSRELLAACSENLSVIIARPFNLVGPGLPPQLVAAGLLQQFMESGRLNGFIAPKGPVESVRDFIDVRDVVSAYWLLSNKGQAGEVYNVCSGHGVKISEVIEIFEKELGFKVEVKPDYDPNKIAADVFVGDNRKLESLGWKPSYTLTESLRSMIQNVS